MWLSMRITHAITKRYVIGLRVTNDFTPREKEKRFSIMPCQTLSTKQSEVAEFGITRLAILCIEIKAVMFAPQLIKY